MMKTVFTNEMVAHIWAQQRQPEGRSNNGHFYFHNETIFSYGPHFPIARFVTNERGERAVLFTTKNYSVTTTQHKSRALGAIPQGVPVFYVEKPGTYTLPASYAQEMLDRLNALVDTIPAKRAHNQASAMADADRQAEKIYQFCTFYDLDMRAPSPLFTPEARAAAEAALQAYDAKRQEKYEARRKVEALSQGEQVAAWVAGAPAGQRVYSASPIRMRVKGDHIETSRGAKFPAEHGAKAFRLIAAARAKGQEWHRNGHTIHLGHFQIDRIEPSGNVHAGCHFVEWSEIARIAGELGLSVEG